MPLDNQLAAVLQGFTAQGEPDYATLDAVQYRLHADNLMPPLPGADMAEVRDLQVAGAAGLLPARLYRPVAGRTCRCWCSSMAAALSSAPSTLTTTCAAPWPLRPARWWCRWAIAWRRRRASRRRPRTATPPRAGWSSRPMRWGGRPPPGGGRGQRRRQPGHCREPAGPGAPGPGDPSPMPVLPGDGRGVRQRVLSRLRRGLPVVAGNDGMVLGAVPSARSRAPTPWPRRCAMTICRACRPPRC